MMELSFLPSLQDLTLLTIVIRLFNNGDIFNQIRRSFKTLNGDERVRTLKEIEMQVREKLFHLPLPSTLKHKAASFIWQVGKQIFCWIDFNNNHVFKRDDGAEEYYGSICWSSQGTIDYKKTAERFLQSETLKISRRFNLACTYCLEEHIPTLWSQIRGKDRKFYSTHVYQSKKYHVIAFWISYLKGQLNNFTPLSRLRNRDPTLESIDVYNYMTRWSLYYSNFVAFKYFWSKITDEERAENAFNWALITIGYERHRNWNSREILFLLLPQINPEQRREIYKDDRFLISILSFFFKDGLRRHLFLQILNNFWNFISANLYCSLLLMVVSEMDKNSPMNVNYRMIFEQMWTDCPNDLKRRALRNRRMWDIVSHLLHVEDIECLKIIFKHATPDEMVNIIFLKISTKISTQPMSQRQWTILRLLLDEFSIVKVDSLAISLHH